MEWIVEAETFEDLVNGLWTSGEKLVRCRDCRYYGHECVLLFPEDGYCYDGKSRDDKDE